MLGAVTTLLTSKPSRRGAVMVSRLSPAPEYVLRHLECPDFWSGTTCTIRLDFPGYQQPSDSSLVLELPLANDISCS